MKKITIFILVTLFSFLFAVNSKYISAYASENSKSTSSTAEASLIKDPNLRKLILKNVQKNENDTLTYDDLLNITYLDTNNLKDINNYTKDIEISSLEGLQYCSNLKVLLIRNGCSINDLSPLKNLTNLTNLQILTPSKNNESISIKGEISDLSPLSTLLSLQELVITNNTITDISTIANLVNLEKLSLTDNKIENIDVLNNLSNLKELDLNGNSISDLTPIQHLTNLEQILLSSNNIATLPNFDTNKNLKILELNYNEITDVSKICLNKPFPNIENLSLSYNDIGSNENLSLLSRLTSLKKLYLTHCNIYDLSNLFHLETINDNTAVKVPALNLLYISGNHISDLSVISDLKTLNKLHASDQEIELTTSNKKRIFNYTNPIILHNKKPATSFSNISNLGSFNAETNKFTWSNINTNTILSFNFNEPINMDQESTFSGTVHININVNYVNIPDANLKAAVYQKLSLCINDFVTEDEMSTINYLAANNKNIYSLEGLQYCTNIQSLSLYNNKISDISPVTNLTKLQKLNLDGNQIYILPDLSNLNNLYSLSLNTNKISDLSGLCNLSTLIYLHLDSNKITDISYISSLINLEELSLCDNSIYDISPLNALVKLTSLTLDGQNIYLNNNLTNDTITVKIPLVYLDDTQHVDIFDINYDGEVDSQSNTIQWHNISDNCKLHYVFNAEIKINNTYSSFSGDIYIILQNCI